MSFGGTTIENAIQSWIVAASGLAGAKVIWAEQGGNRPAPPYIAINAITLSRFGEDWKRIVDLSDDDPPPDAGEEIEIHREGPREIALSIQCFADSPLGTASAMSILNDVQAKVRHASIADALRAGGVSVRRFDAINSLGAIVGATDWEPRATMTAYLGVASDVSEVATYIETTEITEE